MIIPKILPNAIIIDSKLGNLNKNLAFHSLSIVWAGVER